jgi:SpoVK/Ycf46/Vps4 family AAA+-type ATPase
VLLYGAPGTGKSLLAHGIAGSAGALLLDLSPRATDGKCLTSHPVALTMSHSS